MKQHVFVHVVSCDAMLAFSLDENESRRSIPRTRWNEILKNILGAELVGMFFCNVGVEKSDRNHHQTGQPASHSDVLLHFLRLCECVCHSQNTSMVKRVPADISLTLNELLFLLKHS